ncbi:hypothetical protein F2Q70_00022525 [Brassica cretica]|uniref:Uncharacterized protein n=1 Tax=Brassica cretica TaxID=69181 RepID=A0A8S9GP54_BRACR|nr:hypothetical protein F2Q70_00022525 [Brassica cretica]
MDCNDRITGSLGIHNEMPGNGMVSKVHVRCSSKGQVLIQRRRDHDRDLQGQAEPLGGGSFHGVSWRGFTYPGTERVYDGANDYLWQRKMHRRNQVEQVVTTGCNPEEKGYETTVINTCSRSRKYLPQLVEACLEKLFMGSSFDTREAVREYLRSITGLGGVSHWLEDVLIGSAEGGLFISFGRAIGIQEEVFYDCDIRNFAGKELRSKPCAENLAVQSGMTSGLVELAVEIILELVPSPGISGSLSLFGVDSVIMLALKIFSLVVDIPVVARPCETVGVGCGGSEPNFRPVLPALPNRGFLLPLSWAFRTIHPAERTGFAFFTDGRRHLRLSDRTGRLCPDRSARYRLLPCSQMEVEGSPRSVVRLAGLFRQGFDLKNPCLPVWSDRSESRNQIFCRAVA